MSNTEYPSYFEQETDLSFSWASILTSKKHNNQFLKFLLLTCLLLLGNTLFAQDTLGYEEFPEAKKRPHKYYDFISAPNEASQNHLLTGQYQYLITTNYNGFRGGGCILSGGLNLARFFSRKFILGLTLDIKGFKGFTQQRFPSSFVNDFNASFNSAFASHEDSIKANVLKNAINGNVQHFNGNYSGSFGVMFSLFPQRFGGILVNIKRGYRSFSVFNIESTQDFDGEDHPSFYLNKNISVDISFKPFAFFKNSFVNHYYFEAIDCLKMLTVSFYYERLNLNQSNFSGMPLKDIVNTSFLNKYGICENYGIKFGFSFY